MTLGHLKPYSDLVFDDNTYIKSQTQFSQNYVGFGFFGTLETLTRGEGYKFQQTACTQKCEVSYEYDLTTKYDSVFRFQLNKGWNYVGFPFLEWVDRVESEKGLSITTMMKDYFSECFDLTDKDDLAKDQFSYTQYYKGYGWYGARTKIQSYMIKVKVLKKAKWCNVPQFKRSTRRARALQGGSTPDATPDEAHTPPSLNPEECDLKRRSFASYMAVEVVVSGAQPTDVIVDEDGCVLASGYPHSDGGVAFSTPLTRPQTGMDATSFSLQSTSVTGTPIGGKTPLPALATIAFDVDVDPTVATTREEGLVEDVTLIRAYIPVQENEWHWFYPSINNGSLQLTNFKAPACQEDTHTTLVGSVDPSSSKATTSVLVSDAQGALVDINTRAVVADDAEFNAERGVYTLHSCATTQIDLPLGMRMTRQADVRLLAGEERYVGFSHTSARALNDLGWCGPSTLGLRVRNEKELSAICALDGTFRGSLAYVVPFRGYVVVSEADVTLSFA